MTRRLKTWPEFFTDIELGRKTFEIRVGQFKPGDVLELQEFDPCKACQASGEHPNGLDACEHCQGTKGKYTGKQLDVVVTYVTSYGQPFGQQVLGIRKVQKPALCAAN